MPPTNKSTLLDSLLRVIAASFGDLPHSLNLFQSGIWEGSAGPPARKRHPVIGRSSCRGHDASSRCVRRVNGAPTSFPIRRPRPWTGGPLRDIGDHSRLGGRGADMVVARTERTDWTTAEQPRRGAIAS